MSKQPQIEDIYPLSPMQQGLLVHSLHQRDSAAHFVQWSCRLVGQLDVEAFQQAWQQAIDRHPVLRTAIVTKRPDQPLQVVRRQATPEWHIEDLRELDEAAQQARLQEFREADRGRGFKLNKAPLMRMALLQSGDQQYQFIWSHHHILLDGWSLPLVRREVFQFYESARGNTQVTLDRPRPFGQYIAWLAKQDAGQAEAYWRRRLAGFQSPTPVRLPPPERQASPVDSVGYQERSLTLDETHTKRLRDFARQNELTLGTLLQGAWALVLSRYSGLADVVFGVAVSGRPAEIPGVESIVGMFINNLPVRTHVDSHQPVVPWLQKLQSDLAEMRSYEWTDPAKVHEYSEVPLARRLCESLVVFENYPPDGSLQRSPGGLEVHDSHAGAATNYPLTLVIIPRTTLYLGLYFDTQRFDPAHADQMLEAVGSILQQWCTAADAPLGETVLGDSVLQSGDDSSAGGEPAQWPPIDLVELGIDASTAIGALRIVDERGSTVPRGVPGEICWEAAGDAQQDKQHATGGNAPRHGQSAPQVGVPSTAPRDASRSLHHTGRLGRLRIDGALEAIGPVSGQIEHLGVIFVPAEVESVLRRHSQVAAVRVASRDNPRGGQQVVAEVEVTAEPSPQLRSELRKFSHSVLPDALVPGDFVLRASSEDAQGLETPERPTNGVHHRSSDMSGRHDVLGPRDEVEGRIRQIWENVLDVRPIGIRDDFFELGGNSIAVVRLLAEIQGTFLRALPMQRFFAGPTVEHLAQAVRVESPAGEVACLVPLQTSGDRPPLFCVHSDGGAVLVYSRLAIHLRPDQPVYGLQSLGLHGEAEPLERIEDMAAHYIENIRKVQPAGPYYLAGLGLGGIVAFEMARQFAASDQPVGLLALIDAGRPQVDGAVARFAAQSRSGRRLVHHARNLRALPMGERVKYVFDKLSRRRSRDEKQRARLAAADAASPEATVHVHARTFYATYGGAVHEANRRALAAYRPGVYPGKMTYFLGEQTVERLGPLHDPQQWCDLVTGGIDVHRVPSMQCGTLAEPYVATLARELRQVLRDAAPDRSASHS